MGEQRVIYVEGIGPLTVTAGQSVADAIAASGHKPTETATTPAQPAAAPGAPRDSITHAGRVANDFGTGVLKGGGTTAFNLGDAMRKVPLVPGLNNATGGNLNIGTLTDPIAQLFSRIINGEDANPDQAFAQAPSELEPANSTENMGKMVEQIAEFFVPGSKVGTVARNLSGATNLVAKMPKAASPLRRLATDAAWDGSRVAGDAAGAAGVAALHGDENPEQAAAWSAGGGMAGLELSKIAHLLSTKTGQQIAPLLAAMAAMGLIGVPTTGLGLGATMGTFGLAKNMAGRAMRKPGAIGKLGWLAEEGGQKVGTAAAGINDQVRASGPRRRSQP